MYLSAFLHFPISSSPHYHFPHFTFTHRIKTCTFLSLSLHTDARYGSQPHRVSHQNESREMTEKAEDQSFGESLESEGVEDEVSNFGNSKIKYTRALLLELEVWRELPRDFNVLILRELNGESDGTIEKKSISCNSSGHYSLLRRNLGLPGERWDSHLLILDKENHLQNCSLEGKNISCQQLPREDSYGDGVLGQKPPKSDLSQLNKAENPYLPPHCSKKKLQPSDNISELGKESSQESDQETSADSITGNDKYGHDTPLVGVDYSTNKSPDDCGDSLKNTEGDEMFVPDETIKEIIEEVLLEDNQPTFDDFWAEILETIHLSQKESSGENKANSEDETSLPDEDSLISIAPKKSMPTLNPEAELNLPDEDSLISLYDLITPETLMAIRNRDSTKPNKAPFQFPGLMTHRQLHPQQIFGPKKSSRLHDHLKFPPMLRIPNTAPCYMTSYSVLQQPNVLPHVLFDASAMPSEQPTSYQGFRSSNAGKWNPMAAGGFRNEKASGFSFWHTQF